MSASTKKKNFQGFSFTKDVDTLCVVCAVIVCFLLSLFIVCIYNLRILGKLPSRTLLSNKINFGNELTLIF